MDYPNIEISLDTSIDDLVERLYTPCFSWAERYDRGVGYFSSKWIEYNLSGLSDFTSRGGKIRLITSPIISNDDSDSIIAAYEGDPKAYERLNNALAHNVDQLKKEMRNDIKNVFAWMVHDGIIDIRFAIPCNKLTSGDFHAKYGIFYRGDDALSFCGSLNDSEHGFQNFESIMTFSTWSGSERYVNIEKQRFERVWNRKDPNLRIYDAPSAIKERIFELRTGDRPYAPPILKKNKWEHQDKAVEAFLEKEHGILAMATGSGKTRTAIKIIKRLFEEGKIQRVVISMYGNDLLDQWAIQMREEFEDLTIHYHYGEHRGMPSFIMHPDNAMLIVSRDSNNLSKLLQCFERSPGNYKNDTLFIFDEVHGAGSSSIVEALSGQLSSYRFRLGLSATPEREYDDEGNEFLLREIGEVIFTFSLKDAIEKGILCPFNYIPLPYHLTEEERLKKRNIIAAFNAKKQNGEPCDETEMFTQLANVNKTAISKIYEFSKLMKTKPDLLENCIIFVQSMEYGEKLQEVLIGYNDKYHTYYADDEKYQLERFASGEIDCLVTCKKISEGIDIRSVKNIILFSSDRSRLVTTQRIGRALRVDSLNPSKVASIIDFILDDSADDQNADVKRKEWLTELSKIRRVEDEK